MSVIRAKGNKEVVIVDDGSEKHIRSFLRSLQKEGKIIDHDNDGFEHYLGPEFRVHYFRGNRGKRHALYHAITKVISDSDFVVTIDSDTVLDEDALIRVVEPLKSKEIGASTGDVLLLNEKQNWLTRMIGAYYWIGLHIYKQAQSGLGMVVCCSGCLAGYQRDIVEEIIEEFVNQEFFGERCTHSEDRHLTNLVLKRGYEVVFVPEAISHTETPATVKGFLKQQQRWKRGYIRESTYTLSYAWKSRKLLFFQILFWDLTAPFFTLGIRLFLLSTIITNPMMFFIAVLPSWIALMLVRYIFLVFYARHKVPGLFIYVFFYEIFLYWMNIYALFTVRNKSWITR